MPQGATTAYLMLDVAGKPCALPSADVREVLPIPHIHVPPEAGGVLMGFINFAGEPLPVIDLARLLGLRAAVDLEPYWHLVVLAESPVALLVDRAMSLVTIDADAIHPVEASRTLNGCVAAEITLDGRMIHALAPSLIFTAEEATHLAIYLQRARERLVAFAPVE